MNAPVLTFLLSCLLFGIALVQAACARQLRRQAAASPHVAWRVQAVLALVWVNGGITVLIVNNPSTQVVRVVALVALMVLLIGAWYGDRRAKRRY